MTPTINENHIYQTEQWEALTAEFTEITRRIHHGPQNPERINALLRLQFEIEGLKATLQQHHRYECQLHNSPEHAYYSQTLIDEAKEFNNRLNTLQSNMLRLGLTPRPIPPLRRQHHE